MQGRKPQYSDQEVLESIKDTIKKSRFTGEGYVKIRFRMRKNEDCPVTASKERVNRLMRENDLLSPYRIRKEREKHEHNGVIKTEKLNQMWGTDGKKFWVNGSGWHWFFGVIDHNNDEILSWHACKKGDRYVELWKLSARQLDESLER